MHTKLQALEPMADFPDICGTVRATTMGDMTVTHHRVRAGLSVPPIAEGDPVNPCKIRHWGLLLAGRMKVVYTDGTEEIVSAGETFHLTPGHRVEYLEESELIQFSPSQEMAPPIEK